ncbi:MAG: hypothetical protein SWH68_16785 [Thermodesulfobacteriota bacterium]|nr:hypothetical protein [Thermodesulfobacteriota bacterium]
MRHPAREAVSQYIIPASAAKELHSPVYSNHIILFFSLLPFLQAYRKKTEQQHVPSPLQRSRAGAVFSEDAGRLCEQTRLNAPAQKGRRVSARAEKTVPARVAEGQAAGGPFFCILFFGGLVKSHFGTAK